MKLFARKVVLLPIVLAGTLAVGIPQAEAQSLFETSFRRRHSQSENGRRRLSPAQPLRRWPVLRRTARDTGSGNRPRRPVARRPAAVAKISAPSYYNYKAAALQRVDFTALAAIGQSASLDQATSGTAFREAVGGSGRLRAFRRARNRQGAGRILFRQSGFHLDHRQRGERARQRCRACAGRGGEPRAFAGRLRHQRPVGEPFGLPTRPPARANSSASRWRCRPGCCVMRTMPKAAASTRTRSPATTIFRKSRSTWWRR